MMGKDHTIFAVADGMVKFDKSATRARICIVPVAEGAEDAPPAPETRKTRKYAKCVTRGAPARKRCGSCRAAAYCCKAHQEQAWPQHKRMCAARTDADELRTELRAAAGAA